MSMLWCRCVARLGQYIYVYAMVSVCGQARPIHICLCYGVGVVARLGQYIFVYAMVSVCGQARPIHLCIIHTDHHITVIYMATRLNLLDLAALAGTTSRINIYMASRWCT